MSPSKNSERAVDSQTSPSLLASASTKKHAETRAHPTVLMQDHPPFVYFNCQNDVSSTLSSPQPTSIPPHCIPMDPELSRCRCLLSRNVNAAAGVVIGMAAVISCVPPDQGGGQSRPGGGVSMPPSAHFLRDRVGFRRLPEGVPS
jgi:hypothetical protein